MSDTPQRPTIEWMASLSLVDLVGVGLNATDTLIHLPHFPARGSKTEYTTELVQPGGQVASAVIACQMWGLNTRYVGKLGDDAAADLHEREFTRCGVEWHTVRVPGASSPKSLIMVDAEGERTILGRRDDRLCLRPEDLRREWVTSARVLLIDGHDVAAATLAARWARAAGVAVVADLDELYPGVEDVIADVDYLIVSRDFPSRFTGERDLSTALQQIRQRFGCRLTAATLGTHGVLAWDGDKFHHAPAYRVPAVDTTGAGDLFHAGFIFGLRQGWPTARQLDFSCAAAAMNCTAQGARGGIRSVDEIERLMLTGERYDRPALAMPYGETYDTPPLDR